MLKKCAAEFVGAFAIVLAGCGAVASSATPAGVAATFGLVVMAMVYATGRISGAHLNPAVTLGFAAARRFPLREVAPYVASQIAGAVAASLIHRGTLGSVEVGVTRPPDGAFATALVWESLLTFLLMFVISAVAGDRNAGIAIGGTVAFGAVLGASMNPARSLGPALVSGDLAHLGAYIVGPVLGAIAAAWLYAAIRCEPGVAASQVKGCC